MLESSKIKYLRSLHLKKFRQTENQFIIEGVKMVNELLSSNFETTHIYATDTNCIETNFDNITTISEKELERISCMKTPNKVLATAKIPLKGYQPEDLKNELSIILEDVQDPGNMGTIIRLAGWYGIKNIFCSYDTVECFNPKVVQASMGAIFKVSIHYADIYTLVNESQTWVDFNTYVTHLQGQSIYEAALSPNGFIVMGNESKGISDKFTNAVLHKLRLPAFPPDSQNIESLNVAVATALTVAEFRRRQL